MDGKVRVATNSVARLSDAIYLGGASESAHLGAQAWRLVTFVKVDFHTFMFASAQTMRLGSRIPCSLFCRRPYMAKEAQDHQNTTPPFQVRPSSERARFHFPLRAADAKRSVENILQWNSFLPIECERTMVRLGWDFTT